MQCFGRIDLSAGPENPDGLGHVALDRTLLEAELDRDLLVGLPVVGEPEALAHPRRQTVEPVLRFLCHREPVLGRSVARGEPSVAGARPSTAGRRLRCSARHRRPGEHHDRAEQKGVPDQRCQSRARSSSRSRRVIRSRARSLWRQALYHSVRRSADTVAKAKAAIGASTTMVPEWRDTELLRQAGFRDVELFYAGMAWRGWVAYV